MPRSSRSCIDQSPLAVTSSGEIVVGLAYTRDLRTVAEAIEVLSTTSLKRGERLFVGVVLHGRRRDEAHRRLDDAAAEAASWSSAGVPRKSPSTRRRQP